MKINLLHGRYSLYAMLVIITIAFASTYSKVYDVKLDMNGDNIYYYALGKALSEGKGFTNTTSFTETPHTHFPPGYPVFVAGVMKFFPDSINAVKIANGFLLYASLLLLFFLIRRLSGDVLLAFVTCLLCSIHAELLRYATIMMSEMLFLLFTVGAIYLSLSIDMKQIFTRRGIWHTVAFVGLVFSMNYIYFIRTMGTSLILAIIIYSGLLFAKQLYISVKARQKVWSALTLKYGIVFLILAASFMGTKAGWDVRNKSVGKTSSDYIGDFKKKPDGQVMTTWEDWGSRVKSNFNTYLDAWIPNAILYTTGSPDEKPTAGEMMRGIFVALLVVWGLVGLSQGGLLLFLYVGATMAVLLVWPEQYGGLRYFIGIVPFFIFLFLNGMKEMIVAAAKAVTKKRPTFWPAVCICVFALLFMLPNYSKALSEKKEMAKYKVWNTSLAGNAFVEFSSAMQWCGKNLPDSARVICRKPELFYMYSGGRQSAGFSQYGKPEVILKQLIDNKATHVIIDHWFRHAYLTLYPLISTYYPEKFKLVCSFGGKNPQEPPTLIFEFHAE